MHFDMAQRKSAIKDLLNKKSQIAAFPQVPSVVAGLYTDMMDVALLRLERSPVNDMACHHGKIRLFLTGMTAQSFADKANMQRLGRFLANSQNHLDVIVNNPVIAHEADNPFLRLLRASQRVQMHVTHKHGYPETFALGQSSFCLQYNGRAHDLLIVNDATSPDLVSSYNRLQRLWKTCWEMSVSDAKPSLCHG